MTCTEKNLPRLHSSKSQNSVLHYCDINALKSIVTNNSFWLSDSEFMNDPLEYEYGNRFVLFYFLQLYKLISGEEFSHKSGDTIRIDDLYFDILADEKNLIIDSAKSFYCENKDKLVIEEKIYKLCSIFLKKQRYKFYIGCFSNGDESLSQWRSYCKDAQGYAVNFDKDELKKFIDQVNKTIQMSFMLSGAQQIFDSIDDSQGKLLFCDDVKYTFENKISILESNILESLDRSFDYSFFLRLGIFYKKKDYASENEFRLVFMPNLLRLRSETVDERTQEDELMHSVVIGENGPEPMTAEDLQELKNDPMYQSRQNISKTMTNHLIDLYPKIFKKISKFRSSNHLMIEYFCIKDVVKSIDDIITFLGKKGLLMTKSEYKNNSTELPINKILTSPLFGEYQQKNIKYFISTLNKDIDVEKSSIFFRG